jgi:AcrR family transcriptional regulator
LSLYVDKSVYVETLANVDRFVYNERMPTRNISKKVEIPARERIVRTAHDLFYRVGIRATGIDRIIAESGVTKVTFYRHFPSKNDLIKAYLEYRHELWMSWFVDALNRHQSPRRKPTDVLVPVFDEWFHSDDYRGCAFINTVVEFDGVLPEVLERSLRHKSDMTQVIASLLPESKNREVNAQAMAMAIDGAIVRAQMDKSPTDALKILDVLLRSLNPSGN